MAFDIDSAALVETIRVELSHPATGEKLLDGDTPVFIDIYGQGSKQNRDAAHRMQGKFAVQEKKKAGRVTPADSEEITVEFLAEISVKTNLAFGTEVITGKEAFQQLYKNPKYSWIIPQLQEKLGESGSTFRQV